jgi:NADPH-dependent F420 reductase
MRIAIIGSGNVGKALAGAAVRGGHDVSLTARDPEHAAAAARETGARAAGSNRDAVQDAEAVVLAVPYDAVAGIVAELGGALAGKVLVDVSNRFDPNTLDGTSNAEQIQASAPEARVVKAFNTLFASRMGEPVVDGVHLDGFVAGDDAAARAAVGELVRSLGLRPIEAGPLVMARALEALALLNINLNMHRGWSWQTGWKLVGPTAPP